MSRGPLLGFIVLLTLSLSALRAEVSADFSRPHDYLGPTNFEGKIYAWFDLASIPLADGDALPLRVLFSAIPKRGSSLLGSFWWCPLLESRLIPLADKLFLFTTLGGRDIYLNQSASGTLSSGDGAWTGTIVGDEVQLQGPGAWSYTYRTGRIVRARHGSEDLSWVYVSGRLMKIAHLSGKDLISLVYDASGLPSALVTEHGTASLKYARIPLARRVLGQALITGFEPSLAVIDLPARAYKFDQTVSPQGIYSLQVSGFPNLPSLYTWDADTGLLASDNNWAYSRTVDAKGVTRVQRTNKAGQSEAYRYDSSTGTSFQELTDGSTIERTYFLAQGPLQSRIRKLIKQPKGQPPLITTWSYDEAGRLLRETGHDYEKQIQYGEAGSKIAERELRSGVLSSEMLYDEAGRLTSYLRGNYVQKYQYEPTRTVSVKYLDGKVIGSIVTNAADGIPVALVPDGAGWKEIPGAQTASQTKESLQELTSILTRFTTTK